MSLLDICSAPGGKAITALQTHNLSRLVCADVSPSRLTRLLNVLNTFGQGVGSGREGLPDVSIIQSSNIRSFIQDSMTGSINPEKQFDRVIADVPCSTDRHALISKKGSYFSRGKANQRMKLPQLQNQLLWESILACKSGGNIVYTTCTLSPAQNQLVVESCLTRLANSTSALQCAIVDLTPLLNILNNCAYLGVMAAPVYASSHVDQSLKSECSVIPPPIGIQIIPCLANNIGPTFICKLKKL